MLKPVPVHHSVPFNSFPYFRRRAHIGATTRQLVLNSGLASCCWLRLNYLCDDSICYHLSFSFKKKCTDVCVTWLERRISHLSEHGPYCLLVLYSVSFLNQKRVPWLGIIILPRCFLSLIVSCHPAENKHKSKTYKGLNSSVCCVPESFCFCKEMIAGPFLVLYYSEFKQGWNIGASDTQWDLTATAEVCVDHILGWWC